MIGIRLYSLGIVTLKQVADYLIKLSLSDDIKFLFEEEEYIINRSPSGSFFLFYKGLSKIVKVSNKNYRLPSEEEIRQAISLHIIDEVHKS